MKPVAAYMANKSKEYGDHYRRDEPPEIEMRRRRDRKGRYMMSEADGREYQEKPEHGRIERNYIPDYRVLNTEQRSGLYDGGGIGFGRAESERDEMYEFDRDTADEWVRNMQNEDKAHPTGGKWSAEALKPLAQKYGVPTEGEKFWEFYAMTNAMYSDYSEVAKKFGITAPDFYACMAKAFMMDKDAKDDKVALYYEYIAKK